MILNQADESWLGKGLKFGATVARKIKELAQDRWQKLLDNREVFVRYKKGGEFYTTGIVSAENLTDSDA